MRSRVRKGQQKSEVCSSHGKNTYKLSDQQTPEKFAAQKVTVTGTLYPKTGVIKVDKMEAIN